MKRYLWVSILVSATLLLVFYTVNHVWFKDYLHKRFPTLVTFFFLQSLPISWLLRQGEKNQQSFPMYAMGSIGFRMLTGLFALLIFYVLETPDIKNLSIQFVGVYLIYLAFELTVVIANLRRN